MIAKKEILKTLIPRALNLILTNYFLRNCGNLFAKIILKSG